MIPKTVEESPIRESLATPWGSPAITPPPSSAVTGVRLGKAVLAYVLAVTLIITLLPFQFAWPERWRIMTTGGPVDIIANVLLFIPLGFLYRLARRQSHRHSVMPVLAAGLAVSMGIESLQLFEIERYTSVLDVLTNGLGAVIGAVIYDRVAHRTRFDARLIGRLSLELPLMGLVYLLVPLLWLNALSSAATPGWAWIALLVAVTAGLLAGGLQRHHFGPEVGARPGAAALFAGVVVFLGMFPALPSDAPAVLLGAAMASALTWWIGSRPLPPARAAERRFEIPVLLSAAPSYAAYVALLVIAPLLGATGSWSVGAGFAGVAQSWSKGEILRCLELLAAFTLLGYMVAEYSGRPRTTYTRLLPRVAIWGASVSAVVEFAHGFRAGYGASVSQWALFCAGAVYGGWLYHLQRNHVLQILREQAGRNRLPKHDAY